MQYTGTRYQTARINGYSQMTGSAEFVSNRLNPQTTATAPFGNAGGRDVCCAYGGGCITGGSRLFTSLHVLLLLPTATGAFCTSKTVVGCGAYLSPTDPRSGSYAGFW
jgi:hypothetical protein